MVQSYKDESAKHFSKCSELMDSMQALPAAEWQDVDVERYLAEALWTVYCGVVAYEIEMGELPLDIETLVQQGYIAAWPRNPFTEWSPIQVVSAADTFSPGNLTFQVCPIEFYSIPTDPRPLSFELGIYGPTIEFADLGNATGDKHNTWAAVPEGTLYMLGSFTETVAQSLVKAEKRSRKREKARQEESGNAK